MLHNVVSISGPSFGVCKMTDMVVKFMVKVRDIEKRVNSHVGRVMVAKVISQKSNPGITLTTPYMAWGAAERVDVCPWAIESGLRPACDV
jgi:hypothetical protein